MSQIVRGTHLGVPNMYILCGNGDPNSITDFGVGVQGAAGLGTIGHTLPPQNIGIGSLYLRMDAPDLTHALYVKTDNNGTWTAK